MDLGLAGKRALVTGSSSGIGAASARMLAAEGCEVVVHGRDAQKAASVAEDIERAGGLAHVVIGDLASDVGANSVIEGVAALWDGVDILVNNVGGGAGPPVAWEDVDETTWLGTYQKNVVAAARLIRRYLPGMRERAWGRLIQVGSASATQPIAVLPDYAAAKAAITNMSVSLARSLAGTGVTANTVTPGRILTPAVERAFAGRGSNASWTSYQADGAAGTVPMGKPEDLGFAICMLASMHSNFITGANIRVDGGQMKSVN
ncbi:SDR family NAD(P)-dependent oxidoreductase [Novosphingobium sp. G106]|uniref:SDR family NAD(P)-dependent oxidoreductase n=1 Tax=Novosphingobium sp. G106 TaxID=2849500 RepID=UPI001C2D694B|nr:SDR family NAD(P)-dependent oxidoreductase [Novosphingobium sp. G106]MBV1688952.1 SDR family NAD(P)-dependent oxidoreductase [Novosphingobium sp. G106]